MSGIHLHPHDILDEDVDNIISRLAKMGDVDHLFVEVNTIFERNPYPVGNLPHNPVHQVVMGTGTLHARLNDYQQGALHQRVDPTILAGQDPLAIIKQQTDGTEMKVIPWVNILNGDFAGDLANNQVIDFQGDPVEHWLCPNAPDVIELWKKTFHSLQKTYGYDTYLIDRIRFPDWAGKTVSPRGLLTCFCPHCRKKMQQQNIDINNLIFTISQLVILLKQHEYDVVVDYLLNDPLLKRWQQFRQQSISDFVKNLLHDVNQHDGSLKLWLDLWPPAYSWILGQDYTQLTKLSPALKHFPYHKLGGGADVQGLINFLAKTPEKQEAAFSAFLRLFNLPYDLSYQQFKQHGFPIAFVKQQNDIVRERSQPGTWIFSGIQMWNIDADGLLEAVKAAKNSACDDLLYYCYGWATDDLFTAIGQQSAKR
ncbi:hypothetical protein I2492_03735 [Budviciaceae bacterium CWB-B4]|uniref:Uncharacterized protein n=1 Tax=Limnobaculum xujianqingii TaxID=2738837 RepID=A0A9D7AG42_9GAMM|nr:hypothetical protein [Limnobaculum xujianqingii]MBK5072130.1 hypothetical protein [Limnobaculum xujianqingii]MBK5175439.1 hypothetical protein [Limnobaculum xujianqingii]